MAVAVSDMEVDRERELRLRFPADAGAPEAAREAVEAALDWVDPGVKLAAGVLARAAVAMCVRDHGGMVHVALAVNDRARVEVSGAGDGFRLPSRAGWVDEVSLVDADQRPLGWRAYLLTRLADEWGIDDEHELVWFELDRAPDCRRLQTRPVLTSAA